MEQRQFGEPSEEGLFEESINLRHYWHIVLERRWLVAATFAVVMVLCLFYLFTVTPIFSATTRLQIDNETENSMRMESFVMEGNQGQDYLQTQYKNLQSRSLMKTVLLETQQNAKILDGIKSGMRAPSQLAELSGLATGQVEQRLQRQLPNEVLDQSTRRLSFLIRRPHVCVSKLLSHSLSSFLILHFICPRSSLFIFVESHF